MSAQSDTSAARILVIVPSFNEAENIAELSRCILRISPDIDLLIVDDASPDGTAAIIRALVPAFGGRLRLLERRGKGGRGSAVLEGFRLAIAERYDVIFEMDADFSHKPEEIPRFLAAIRDADVVVGSRYLPGSSIENWGWKRTFFSRWANRYARLILGIPLSDYTNGYRCYRRCAIEALELERINALGYVVLSEVAYQLHLKGLRIAEVPTVFVNRQRGISNLSFHEIKEAFLSVLRIRFAYVRGGHSRPEAAKTEPPPQP